MNLQRGIITTCLTADRDTPWFRKRLSILEVSSLRFTTKRTYWRASDKDSSVLACLLQIQQLLAFQQPPDDSRFTGPAIMALAILSAKEFF
jgi:hypothetical protein